MLGFPRPGKRPANALLLGELGLSSDDQPKLRVLLQALRPQLGALFQVRPGMPESRPRAPRRRRVGRSRWSAPLSWTPERWRPTYRKPYPPEFRLRGSHERPRFDSELFPVAAWSSSAEPFTTSSRAAEGQQTVEIEPTQSCTNQTPEARRAASIERLRVKVANRRFSGTSLSRRRSRVRVPSLPFPICRGFVSLLWKNLARPTQRPSVS
jgi:hypothetical protein